MVGGLVLYLISFSITAMYGILVVWYLRMILSKHNKGEIPHPVALTALLYGAAYMMQIQVLSKYRYSAAF